MLNFLKSPRAIAYKSLALFHWSPREAVLLSALDRLQKQIDMTRIIDVGCGPGLLGPSIEKLGQSYLGLDLDDQHISYARSLYPESSPKIQFWKMAFHELPFQPAPTDVVVFNGVLHHMDDATIKSATELCSTAGAVIILDHYLEKSGKKPTPRHIQFMQSMDRGKYVREFQEIARIFSQYRFDEYSVFPIKIASLPVWSYFCLTLFSTPNSRS